MAASTETDPTALARRPEAMVELSTTQKYSFEDDALTDYQLQALRKRFRDLVDKIPVLANFAEDQSLGDITSIEDGVKLLFPHTLYKSYPLAVLEEGRFDLLTRWLNGLSVYDLSGLDVSSCGSIDDWVDLLDAQTEVRVRHSSGTTGKLSFIPASIHETRASAWGMARGLEGFGDEPDAHWQGVGEMPFVVFSHQQGAQAATRMGHAMAEHFYAGKGDQVLFLNPGRLSADLLSLGGRMEGARSRGELGKTELAPALLARRDAFVREQGRQPELMREFLAEIADRFGGGRIFFFGNLHVVIGSAVAGLERGYQQLFAADSLASMAGGTKGRTLPEDFEDQFERWAGFKIPPPGYGMSEAASSMSRMCPSGKYHVPPNIIPYLLDPVSGDPLPRTGRQTGRYGIIDVAAQSRWGGFLSSDAVTISWNGQCPCGRKGAFLEAEIRRYSDQEGGDDKINCAGAPDVHDRALAFIAESVQ